MRTSIRSLPLALSILLSACAGIPSQPPHQPGIGIAPAATVEPEWVPPAAEPATSPSTDVWDRLRGSFAMADCDADPEIMTWAKRYTRHPERFESQLQAVLPRLVYVQQVAAHYDVPGEFVLMPWVESHFQPIPARKRLPAGMWQIVPVTAGAMGLRVDGHYDGRLDVPAATNAVMKLLEQYHDQFHDWRVADYAYNAGEFAVRKIIRKHGMPADQPALPDWPVRRVTREHLIKLLAMACVVREPGRFNVSLPRLSEEQHLVKMEIPHSMPIARAADHAGMPVGALKHLNAGFRTDMVDASAASYLILPARHARQLHNALLDTSGDGHLPGFADDTSASIAPASKARPKTHTVKPGDSLWQIARRYSVKVTQLQRWNHLRRNTLKPGQVLQVSGTH